MISRPALRRGNIMDKNNHIDAEVVLRQWRTTILNGFFTIAAIISLPALAAIVVNAISNPDSCSILSCPAQMAGRCCMI